MRNTEYTRSRQHWNGVEIEVAWCPDWLSFDNGERMGHLQVQSITPQREPLSITETGYRSRFVGAGEIEAQGGPDEYVRLWLTYEARSEAWREADSERRQGLLF